MEKRKKFTRVVPEEIKVIDLHIDEITCGTTKCEEGFHCYSKKKTSNRKYGKERVCKECGADLVDWKRIHKNNLSDSDYVFEVMKTEIIRHAFWHTPIEEDALLKAYSRGRIKTEERTRRLLKTRIGKYTAWDGRQTPMGKDELVNYAQHATATCCRQCLEAWHNIEMEKPLTEKELDFCTSLVMKYIDKRLPHLEDDGIFDEDKLKNISREDY